MVDRVVRAVKDEEVDVPEVVVRYLPITEVNNGVVDPFSKPAEEIKSMRGMSAGFKRSTTAKMKKFYRGDNAATTQIEDDIMSGYDVLSVVSPPHNLDHLAKLYELSPPHYAAINAKVANIVGLGFNFIETSATKRLLETQSTDKNKLARSRKKLDLMKEGLYETLDNFNEEDTILETLTKFWRDYEAVGNAYLEIGRKADGKIGYLGHIPAQTMRVRRQRDGYVQISGTEMVFFKNFGDTKGVNPISNKKTNEVIHMKKYSPTNSYYGVPDIAAAMAAIAGNEMASRYNLEYFENKAVPRHLVILKGAKLGPESERRLLEFFETKLKGQNHRSLFIPLPADDNMGGKVEFSIKPVEAGKQDFSFDNFIKSNRADILMSHRVPISKIGLAEGVSLAVAKDADKTFKEQVCAPEQKILEKKFNRIIKEMTDAFEFKLNEMTLTDEDTKSKIYERLIKVGALTRNEVRAEMGRTGIAGGDKIVKIEDTAKTTTPAAQAKAEGNRTRDASRSANATDNNAEARTPQGEGRADGTQ